MKLKKQPSLEDKLKKLFRSQKLGILATEQKNIPYTSLVAFACADDMSRIVFATAKTTRKFSNIVSNSNVSLFIDNRSNRISDFKKALGVTVIGSARRIGKNKNSSLMRSYLEKYPNLKNFLSSPDCVLVCIDVASLHVVERFQDCTSIFLR